MQKAKSFLKAKSMYFLKTDGTDKVGKFVQIRDEDFALIEYFGMGQLEYILPRLIQDYGLNMDIDKLREKIEQAPYNKIIQLEDDVDRA